MSNICTTGSKTTIFIRAPCIQLSTTYNNTCVITATCNCFRKW
nr:hypothetical protein Iba_chr02bCG13980 [Ipomoea batatas]GMC63190.1 hypothetical protein Iba_chr02cCG10980 [Ipomoea batatas]GMC64535.1 hypothetical protein Iba_chr02dCG5880 [Ipomoea batatas]GMC66501.1 hypothetical protein Iba_chr02eCG6300 [Ipomoea batatas]GMC68080.1 hypothetical protein Iba_chr02fCG8540 [Ipomoea batatas]